MEIETLQVPNILFVFETLYNLLFTPTDQSEGRLSYHELSILDDHKL